MSSTRVFGYGLCAAGISLGLATMLGYLGWGWGVVGILLFVWGWHLLRDRRDRDDGDAGDLIDIGIDILD